MSRFLSLPDFVVSAVLRDVACSSNLEHEVFNLNIGLMRSQLCNQYDKFITYIDVSE